MGVHPFDTVMSKKYKWNFSDVYQFFSTFILLDSVHSNGAFYDFGLS